jgi:CheY-like chemotaxis protein
VREASDERVRRLPVVVLTHSEVLEDVLRSYDLGANSHIAKPHSLDALFDVVETLGRYWLNVVSLPN